MHEYIEDFKKGMIPENPRMKWIGKNCKFIIQRKISNVKILPSFEELNNGIMHKTVPGEIVGSIEYIPQDLEFFKIIKDGKYVYIGENHLGKYRLNRVCANVCEMNLDGETKIYCKITANELNNMMEIDYIGSGSHADPKNTPSLILDNVMFDEKTLPTKNIERIKIKMINDFNNERFMSIYLKNARFKKGLNVQSIKLFIGKNILTININNFNFLSDNAIQIAVRDIEIT